MRSCRCTNFGVRQEIKIPIDQMGRGGLDTPSITSWGKHCYLVIAPKPFQRLQRHVWQLKGEFRIR